MGKQYLSSAVLMFGGRDIRDDGKERREKGNGRRGSC